jgi:RNA methyltransferase, TrmH family
MTLITSTANEQVKFIRKLREKKYRSESGLFYVEGIRIVVEAMQSDRVKTLIVAPELVQSKVIEEVLAESTKKGVALLEVSAAVFETFSLKDGPQGVAALVEQKWQSVENINFKDMGLWVGLDAVADPGNLGTIMRTLDAVGARGIFLIGPCTDPYDPSAIRASMGAVFSLQLVKVDIAGMTALKGNNSLFVVGTSDAAKEDYQQVKFPADMVLMMGSERQGLQKELMDLCDHMVSIPMAGKSDSLNLAVATGVMLYEVYNQQRRKPQA